MEDKNTKLEKNDKKDAIKAIISKIIFPIEFIISILFTILLYKFICVKEYQGIIKYTYLVGIIITGSAIIAIIIRNYIKNKDKIEKIFLSFIIPVGMLYLIFMMPTYVPDEYAHIWKSYQISEGIILTPLDEQGKSHTEVPQFFATNIIRIMNSYSDMNTAINQTTDYSNKIEVETTAQNYPPILYIFSSFRIIYIKNYWIKWNISTICS